MGETDYNSLPVILLSAKDNAAASYIISEIIDNDVTESYKAKEGDVVQDRIWRIINKYYTADVRLHECGDQQLPIGDEPLDAHIIYLQEDECTVSTCSRRAVPGADVRLVLSAAGPAPLRAWCAAQRYELVCLSGEDGEDGEEGEGEECGAGRVRAALHAHVWRGLVRTDRPAPAGVCTDNGADSDGSSSDAASDVSSGSESEVERAEQFAAALSALPGAALAARDGTGAREARLARAELLLAEFCRALGLDMDHC